MAKQTDLFGDAEPSDRIHEPAPVKIEKSALSPAQRRFNQLLARIDTLSRRLVDTEALVHAHRLERVQVLPALHAREHALFRELVFFLDGRLNRKGLTPLQQRQARRVLCSLAGELANGGDAEMGELFERHSDCTLAERDKAAADDIQAFLRDTFGLEIDDSDDLNSPDAVLQAVKRKMEAESQAEQAKRERRKAKRPNKKEQLAAQQEQDAGSALRAIYRQLASALHPDRERDPDEQARKHRLMTEVNSAYDRKDLLSLLRLQLSAEQIDVAAIDRLAGDKLAAFTHLLNQQAKALEQDLFELETHARHEFQIAPFFSISAAILARDLADKRSEAEDNIAAMEADLARVQDDKQLKVWLKQQDRLLKSEAAEGPSFSGFY